jgi:hypothetical protein
MCYCACNITPIVLKVQRVESCAANITNSIVGTATLLQTCRPVFKDGLYSQYVPIAFVVVQQKSTVNMQEKIRLAPCCYHRFPSNDAPSFKVSSSDRHGRHHSCKKQTKTND